MLVGSLLLLGSRLVAGPSPARPANLPSPVPSASPVRPAVPVLRPAALGPLPEPTAIARALAPEVADPALGGQLAGVVLGVDGQTGFARAAGKMLPPASTAKLATAVAALSTLGPNARFTTRVLRRGATVVLVGGGDPTLASPAAAREDPTLASLDVLAAATAGKLRASGTRAVSLGYDTARYTGPRTGPGWGPGYVSAGDVAPVSALMVDGGRVRPDRRARHPDPAAAAAAMFSARLAARGVAIRGAPRPATAGPATQLAAVRSPAIPRLVEIMLTSSDNNLAEALGREVAARGGLPRTFAGAAEGIRRAVEAIAVDPSGLRLVDASGLSPLNRATPAVLAGILVAAVQNPALHGLFAGLPVAGFTGTLLDRFRRGPAAAAAGLVRAKTGTLTGVSGLAGVVPSRAGALFAFAFLAPQPPSRIGTQAALDRLAARLAAL